MHDRYELSVSVLVSVQSALYLKVRIKLIPSFSSRISEKLIFPAEARRLTQISLSTHTKRHECRSIELILENRFDHELQPVLSLSLSGGEARGTAYIGLFVYT